MKQITMSYEEYLEDEKNNYREGRRGMLADLMRRFELKNFSIPQLEDLAKSNSPNAKVAEFILDQLSE